ncbi:MAG: potassium channel protein [Peptococcaceae bacterium]|nr:potassium channel protein [Peptococcaceae bacterium]
MNERTAALVVIKKLRISFFVLALIVTIGTAGFYLIEGLSLFDAFYFTVETVTTVGFGDIKIATQAGKIFSIFLMVCGAAVMFYLFGLVTTFTIEGQLFRLHGRRKMFRKINKLYNHVIVCGAGRVGIQVINNLIEEELDFVVIEQNEELVESLMDKGILIFHGDAANDENLVKAGIERAKGLVTTLPEDSQNVYVTLTAKELNPQIEVVARTNSPSSEPKLRRAGADEVVSPASLGGRRMAMLVSNPASVEYFDFIQKNSDFKILEILVLQGTNLDGMAVGDISFLGENSEVTLLAIVRDKTVIHIIRNTELVKAGDILIFFGQKKELEKIKEIFDI